MEKILFIINPLSEKRKGIDLNRVIRENLDLTIFDYSIKYSEYHGHALELARDFQKEFGIIVASGGDGTVNQVSEALVGTKSALGLIPLGSGNGLARDLGIPLKPSMAIRRLNDQKKRVIDTGVINNNHFINLAGIGFDAEIAHDFASSAKRGLPGYVISTIRKFFRYRPYEYTLSSEDNVTRTKAFLISFANTSQYGNNARISPKALPDDGLMDICILRKFHLCIAPFLVARLFLKSADRSKYLEIIRTKTLRISGEHEIQGHLDGEPVVFDKEMMLIVKEKALTVLV